MELTDNDKQRIEQEAKHKYRNTDDAHIFKHFCDDFKAGAEYATIYERQQQVRGPEFDRFLPCVKENNYDPEKLVKKLQEHKAKKLSSLEKYQLDRIEKLEAERTELENLKLWKKQQMEIWLPLIEYMHEHGKELGMRYGEHVSEKALQIIKERTELINLLKEVLEYEGRTVAPRPPHPYYTIVDRIKEKLNSLKTK